MRHRSGTGPVWKVMGAVSLVAVGWWLVRRVWLAKEITEVEPPVVPASPPPRRESHRPDPVDEAIAESFPASDPPSYAGVGGHGDHYT